MINQGFVTDSDTEKELKKWQQARTTAVDEDKLKQQYKNRLNNAQGQHFEREILAGCRMYESHGIATIDKTPEPFRVTSKNHRTGEFTGRFSTHAQPDFQGTLYLPSVVRILFTEKQLVQIAESVLAEAKKKWEANENLTTYIENKQQTTPAVVPLAENTK